MNGVSRITVTEDISLVTMRNSNSNGSIIGEIFQEFSNEDINIDMISQTAPQGSTQDVSFTTHSSELLKVLQVMSRIREKYSQLKLMVTTGNCKIQLYGEEMREMSGVAAKVMTTLLSKGIEIIMITTSEIDISLIVSPANQQQAVAELECAFSVTAE